ncbi:MAG: VanZ family protein [Anaerolineaceae bacterium]|nr:MAG: VanZ family protein [Anaerolineaceae bacterium]
MNINGNNGKYNLKQVWRRKLKEITKKRIKIIGWVLFYIYILLLSYFLFFSERYGRDLVTQQYNLHLFKEIKRFIKYREQIGFEGFIVNIFGNVIAFMPYGFLLPLLNKVYRKFYIIVILSFIFSLVIETAQLLLKVGVFDVDDILMNSLGGILGYLIFWLIHSIFKSKEHR